MFSKSKVKKVDFVTLSKFYGKYKEALQLELINSPAGLSRHICEPALNRPGLAIAGFYSYFANKRIQVFGSAELAYLQKLPEGMRKSRIQRMFRCEVPGIVFSRDQNPPREIVELADEAGVCVFRTSLVTMKFVNSATIILENEFAESVTLHGCMVDVRGVGVLIRGKSGVGKSETALGLIERGAALVADDMVYVRNVGGELVASARSGARGLGGLHSQAGHDRAFSKKLNGLNISLGKFGRIGQRLAQRALDQAPDIVVDSFNAQEIGENPIRSGRNLLNEIPVSGGS